MDIALMLIYDGMPVCEYKLTDIFVFAFVLPLTQHFN